MSRSPSPSSRPRAPFRVTVWVLGSLVGLIAATHLFDGLSSSLDPAASSEAERGDATLIDVVPDTASSDQGAQDLVDDLRALPSPDASQVGVTGEAAEDVDLIDSIADRLALALAIAVGGTLVLLFAFTTAAALILIVFLGFAAGDLALVKQLGVGLAIAIAIDATLVRLILVPATMTLAGRANWWSPPTIARLRRRFGIEHP